VRGLLCYPVSFASRPSHFLGCRRVARAHQEHSRSEHRIRALSRLVTQPDSSRTQFGSSHERVPSGPGTVRYGSPFRAAERAGISSINREGRVLRSSSTPKSEP